MAITKTVVTLTSSDSLRSLEFEADGEASSIVCDGLDANTEYTASAYVVDDYYGRINAEATLATRTLSAGTATFSNDSGVWETTVAQLTFTCDWSCSYIVPNNSANFSVIMSKNSDFSSSSTMAPTSVTNYGTSGTLSANCTQQLPRPGETYYVKCQVTDTYGEMMESQTFTYTVPVVTVGGSMSFTPHQQGTYNWWMPTHIPSNTWTYKPKYKYMVYSSDDWASYNRGQKVNWGNNASGSGYEIFLYIYYPNDWKIELEVEDIYGNVFRTSQGYEATITIPYFYFGDNKRGGAYWWANVHPTLAYASATLVWTCTSDSSSGEVDLLPITNYHIQGDITLPDGDYEAYIKIEYDGTIEVSNTSSATLLDKGYIEVTDTSTVNGSELQWSCTFEEGNYHIESATLVVYDCNYGEELAANVEITIDGNTMSYATPITIPDDCLGDYLYIEVYALNSAGYTNVDDYEIQV